MLMSHEDFELLLNLHGHNSAETCSYCKATRSHRCLQQSNKKRHKESIVFPPNYLSMVVMNDTTSSTIGKKYRDYVGHTN